jgi:hypothetical protein
MTPLAEYTYKKWHFDRIITIGDATHKVSRSSTDIQRMMGLTLSGHSLNKLVAGGNAAIEAGAVLVNSLVKHLGGSPSASLSDAQISSIFDEVQNTRYARVQKLVVDSHEHQRVEALDTPFHKFLALKMLPLTDTDNVLFNVSRNVPQGKMLDMFKLPVYPRLFPIMTNSRVKHAPGVGVVGL